MERALETGLAEDCTENKRAFFGNKSEVSVDKCGKCGKCGATGNDDHYQKERFFTDPQAQTNIPMLNQATKIPLSHQDEVPCQRSGAYELFESQICAIAPEIGLNQVRKLFSKFNDGNLLEAVNYYFNNIDEFENMDEQEEEQELQEPAEVRTTESEAESQQQSINNGEQANKKRKVAELEECSSEFIYIGSLSIDAWCTRSVFKKFQYGHHLKMKVNTNFLKFYDNEREVGKVPEQIASKIIPLLNMGIIHCVSTVIYNDKRLSIGDSFLTQIDFYLCRSVLIGNHASLSSPLNNSTTRSLKNIKVFRNKVKPKNDFNSAVNSEEEQSRLRGICLTSLFEKLELQPFNPQGKNNNTDGNETEPITILSDDEDNAISFEGIDEIKQQQEKEKFEEEDQGAALGLNQLKKIYESAQSASSLQDFSLGPTTPKNFKLELRPYQKSGLSWLLKREREYNLIDHSSSQSFVNDDNEGTMHPLYKEYEFPKDRSWEMNNNKKNETKYTGASMENEKFYFNSYNGDISLEKAFIKTTCTGGILADEMGLGKTISTLALIHTCPYDTTCADFKTAIREKYAFKTTLIVVPMSLLSQWEKEFMKATNNKEAYKCLVYYGGSGVTITDILHSSPTVVITTYGTIQAEFSKNPHGGLFEIKFFRIVLDEGHTIRNRSTKTAKACYSLDASRRWILTGTPIINRLDDIFSLVKFLQLSPWDNFNIWNNFVIKPFEDKDLSKSLETLEGILAPVILRRTKNQKDEHGNPLVVLPDKEVVIQKLKFNKLEKTVYDYYRSKATLSLKAGNVFANYSNILTHILRLRQVCCHLDLVQSNNLAEDEEDADTCLISREDDELHSVLETLSQKDIQQHQHQHQQEQQQEHGEDVDLAMEKIYSKYPTDISLDSECLICTESPIPLRHMAVTNCQHRFCLRCILQHLEFQDFANQPCLCPVCKATITKETLFRVITLPDSSSYKLIKYREVQKSTKITALLNTLMETPSNESVVVFSPFSSFLDLIEQELMTYQDFFQVFKFDGRLKMDARENILTQFAKSNNKNENKLKILLLSLKAGGVGLNLTCASRAILLSPWWAPNVESQAIDRIHRIGQLKQVKVYRFIMENSIEEKMLKIQARKKQIGEIVDNNDEERRQRRIEEIMMLLEE
ncbi:hypothetical protein PACTADRAFT_49588 [Pachysolen tannophilus NRRL Y-2460]|uniref:DNA repair protein RAD5 n=1 Tax=Pachysolen tannophilus NRRL Y-2460 TaxID=669874 RepID=A0A1E4TWR6_PACTA|nr:hypothetical protein PACTADRAFT_49588 [Pachysolen tannophilus NRRL Y-2460]